MKLAEALILRSDLQKRIEQLKNRLRNNVMVQEGDRPSEEPEVLLKEFDDCLLELTDIIKRINRTNNTTKFNEEWTLSDALAERDKLWEKRFILSHVAEAASVKQDRYSRTEIKYISVVNVKELQKQIDKLSKEYRELDTKIQGLNWTIDLI
ncbi:MAG TPA: DIP1984 family protein [Thermoanaerobacterales bacterium]|jgi:hypothetical protein|nr:DIP1984 family protein [Thermoanaerobacterales bacterium]